MTASPAHWTRPRALTAMLVAAFILLAIMVPALALGQPRPARFGWQMYSVAQPAPMAWLQAADGSVRAYDLAEHLAVLRGDIPDSQALGHALCEMEPARAVLVQLRPTQLVRVPCS